MRTKLTVRTATCVAAEEERRPGSEARRFPILIAALIVLALSLSFSSSRAEEANPPAVPQSTGTDSPAAKALDPAKARQLEELRLKVASDSLDSKLQYEFANALHDAGQSEEALLHYDKSLSINPKYVEALVNRGAVLNEKGRVDEAIVSFKRALTVNPRDTKALCNLGHSFYALKNYNEALVQYRLAVAADSTFTEGYYYVGIAFADAGIYREAIREWEKIIEISPNSEAAKSAIENIQALKSFLTSTPQ